MDIRDRILLACRDLARQKGFYNLNMDELARQAGISKRTLYRYFRSKEEIIEATLDSFMHEMEGEVNIILAQKGTAQETVAAIMQKLIAKGQFVVNPSGLNDLRIHYPHLWQKIDAFRLERAQMAISYYMQLSNNQLLREIDPRIVTAVFLNSIQTILTPEFILDNNLTFEATIMQLSKLFMSILD